MPEYRRNYAAGGTYFFTVVAFNRRPWLCEEASRKALRRAIDHVRLRYPFQVDAWVLLPDHLHCLWTLPPGDSDYSTRWRLIKGFVARAIGASADEKDLGTSRAHKGERTLWQRRFWEHTIRDQRDFETHSDYIHNKPGKHRLCGSPRDWPWSTIHRWMATGAYPDGWGEGLGLSDGVSRE
ncbi:MAG: REP-associated tyrosine transposase [Deferrisomatales bacterium]